MVEFSVTILGCGSAKPTAQHHTSSQIVTRLGKLYMIDCGEGTQRQLLKYRFHESQLENIFISHSHGDHCLGLVGLLSSLSLTDRFQGMNIYIPADFEQMLKSQIDFFIPHPSYEIRIHPIECQEPTLIFSDIHFQVTAIPLKHGVPCYGFLFREQEGKRHIKPECIQQYGIPYELLAGIQCGEDFTTADGRVIPNGDLTTPPALTRSYAYLSDTRPVWEHADLLQDVDLMYHDSTYYEGYEDLACQYDHSTAGEAAEFAKKCNAGRLLLGHFSSRCEDPEWMVGCAAKYHPHTTIADEGLTVKILDKTERGALFTEWRKGEWRKGH